MDMIDYKELLEQSPALVVVLDNDFNIVAASDEYLKATKSERKNITGKNLFDVFPDNPKDISDNGESKIRASLNRVLVTKVSENLPVTKYNIPKPGSPDEFETKYWKPVHSPVIDGFNNVKYIIQRVEDVTENETLTAQVDVKKKTLKQIEESNKRFYNLLMQSPFAFSVMKGKEMVITLANDLMKDFWGKGREVEGKTLHQLLPELEDQPFPALIDNVYTTGIPHYANEIFTQLKYNGKMEDRYFNIVYQPHYEADGTVSGVTTIAYDVTEMVLARKKVEESEYRYRMLIEESTVATALYAGPEIRLQYANDMMLTYWGKGKNIIGKPLKDFLPELTSQPFSAYLEAVFTSGKSYTGVEEKADLLVDGKLQTFYFNFTYKALRDKKGEIYGIHHMAIDVTDQVLAKKALEESLAHFRQLADLMPAKISNADAQGNVTYFNKHWLDFSGYDFEALRDFGYHKIMHPDEVGEFRKRLQKAEETGTVLEMEMRFRNKEGGYRWHLNLASPVKDENGSVKMWVGSTTDIHEQKIVAEKIKVSEERFRLLVQQAPVAICVVRGDDYVVETINVRMAEFWGRTIEQVLHKPIFEVLTELSDQGFEQLVDNVYNTGERFVAQELPINLMRNGKLENAYVTFVYEPLRDADGSITGVMALAHEITDQVVARTKIEESETKFRLLMNSIPQKITNADADGKLLFFNQQWVNDTGLTLEELKNGGWEESIHPEDFELTTNNWKHSVRTGEAFDMECRIQNKEGGYRWHLSKVVPIRDENKKILMWVGSNTDIHEQKGEKDALERAVLERTKELEQLNQKLVFQNEEKEKRATELVIANNELAFQNEEKEKRATELMIANKELEAFNYISSHDLQEPLRKIQMFSNRIQETENAQLSETGKDYFLRINKAANRMQTLIRDLLTYSKIKESERKLEKTDLNKVVDEVKNELKETIIEKGATVESNDLCEVNVSPFHLRQLIINLIGNALKFSGPDGPPHVIIRSENVKGDRLINEQVDLSTGKLSLHKNYCHITVADNGIGFNPKYRDKIFELFQRLHGTDQYEGTGIGLAIVKKIVENHHGIITATSELNKGTTFDIYIPA